MTPENDPVMVAANGLSLGTAFADAKQNQDATLAAQVKMWNAGLLGPYVSRYNDWAANMTSGGFVPPERRVPPVVPNSWQIIEKADPLLNDAEQTGPPVFVLPNPLPTYNAGIPAFVHDDGSIRIGARNGGPTSLWFDALPGDGFPGGMTTPVQPDGHEYQKFNSVAGWGWYLQLAGTDGAGAVVSSTQQAAAKAA